MILRFTVHCEDAPSRVVTVERARVRGSVEVCGVLEVWRASCDDADLHYSTRTADGDTPRGAVALLAGRNGWPVVRVDAGEVERG